MLADAPRRARILSAAVALAVVAVGCTPIPSPTASPSASATPRDFTVSTAEQVSTGDPAMITTDVDGLLGANVYQRLMLVIPATGELKPDAATDCIFASRTVYECTLPEKLLFHNGHELTANDVKFSIERALRLNTPGTSVSLLDALDRIVVPDPLTIRFQLDWADNHFGYALAGMAASIVDEQVYDADEELPAGTLPVGSGPYAVEAIGDDGVTFVLNETYLGPLAGEIPRIQLVRVADSVAAETAIAEGTTDLVWRTLDEPALGRLATEIAASEEGATAQGFTRWPLPGTRTILLAWDPDSPHRGNTTLRLGVARSLQQDRTLASIVPTDVAGYSASFPLGGRPKLPKLDGKRINLTLGYLPSAPGHGDLARMIRDRIESLGGISVRLVRGTSADLLLTDRQAWVPTATGWLQRYIDDPLPRSVNAVETLTRRARTSSNNDRQRALADLQEQAAIDSTVLPIAQADGILMVGRGIVLVGGVPFGSGWQLGLWGIRRG